MLSCLLIVPMAAIFGSAFPDVVKSVLVEPVMQWATGRPQPNNPAGGAEGFGKVGAAQEGNAAEFRADVTEAPRWGTQHQGDPSSEQTTYGPDAKVVPAAGMGDPTQGALPAGYITPPADSPYPEAAPDTPPQVGVAPPIQSTAPGGTVRGATAPSGAASDPFTVMERKLRDYGATYYLLETWGNDRELFRFHCKMAIGKDPHYTRHFEATDHDALKAMHQVLTRVEEWRAGRTQ